MLNFQQLILRLQDYWSQQGCALLQPYDMEVGAGTSHTATFLRALGPEPWKAAYVQPSRRPKDGRYGQNPNRLQHYYQYQVVLKPAPANILDLYLGSLEAVGFELKQNDIRFVEDDWENPTLGCWGLGWEVWLNGMEVTQFTYFQQVGGIDCKPITGEITYGRLWAAATAARRPRAMARGQARAEKSPYATCRRRLPCRTAAAARNRLRPSIAEAAVSIAESSASGSRRARAYWLGANFTVSVQR